jgi:hypothetical protein
MSDLFPTINRNGAPFDIKPPGKDVPSALRSLFYTLGALPADWTTATVGPIVLELLRLLFNINGYGKNKATAKQGAYLSYWEIVPSGPVVAGAALPSPTADEYVLAVAAPKAKKHEA